jgi:hypothetical protein
LQQAVGFESHSLRHVIENKLVELIFEVHRIPLSAMVIVFGMSGMQFGPGRENPIKARND